MEFKTFKIKCKFKLKRQVNEIVYIYDGYKSKFIINKLSYLKLPIALDKFLEVSFYKIYKAYIMWPRWLTSTYDISIRCVHSTYDISIFRLVFHGSDFIYNNNNNNNNNKYRIQAMKHQPEN